MKPLFHKANKYKNERKQKNSSKYQMRADNHVQNPISGVNSNEQENNQIIRGYFLDEKSYKELIIQRVNNFLFCVLGFLVLFCLVCYYFVSCKEVQLNQISRETLELNYENEDLQNKVDSLQSYYNIDKAVARTNILERAQQVLEVKAIDTPDININKQKKNKKSTVINY